MEIELILAIDVGGTHISAALINKNTMCLHEQAYVQGEVDSNASRASILTDWDQVLTQVLCLVENPVQACVISIPGPFDYVNGVSQMDGMYKYQAILGMDVKQYLNEKYHIPAKNIRFFNDAHAFLLGEIYHHQ
ncbi:ROK family protein, partial [Brucella sp. 21LCYQ03]|nr:ROK family protein [Brucella sp. 21LCYQ03]